VTVFHDQARITRAGTVALEPGEHTLVLADAPLTLIADSVRAKGHGAGVTLLGVDVKTEYLEELPEQEIRDLEDQLDGLRNQESRLADEDRIVCARLEWLQKLAESSAGSYARGLIRAHARRPDRHADYVASDAGSEPAAAESRSASAT
jgi:hypothetical protein